MIVDYVLLYTVKSTYNMQNMDTMQNTLIQTANATVDYFANYEYVHLVHSPKCFQK